jgi:hypothetical protein
MVRPLPVDEVLAAQCCMLGHLIELAYEEPNTAYPIARILKQAQAQYRCHVTHVSEALNPLVDIGILGKASQKYGNGIAVGYGVVDMDAAEKMLEEWVFLRSIVKEENYRSSSGS